MEHEVACWYILAPGAPAHRQELRTEGVRKSARLPSPTIEAKEACGKSSKHSSKLTSSQRILTTLVCDDIPGRLVQVDASNGQVFGVNGAGQIYAYLGTTWAQLPGALIHVTVGPAGVWGVNSNHNIYRLVGGAWKQTTGLLKQIDAGGRQFVAGVNRDDNIYCLPKSSTVSADGTSALPWVNIEGKLKYLSCGSLGCWGVNSNDNIYFRHGVTPDSCSGSRWQQVPGGLSMIEVSTDGAVYGVNSAGNVYRRDGVTVSNPIGTTWTQINNNQERFKHVSFDLGFLWLLTADGSIKRCKDVSCEQVPGALVQIDAGKGQVFGVNRAGQIYSYLGTTWQQLPGALTHVTVGPAGVWGVNSANKIYRLIGGTWKEMSGLLKQIDAGRSQFVAGVNRDDNIYCLPTPSTNSADGNSALPWVNIDGKLKYYSCGPLGCWGVNANDNIYFRHGITSDSCIGSRWQQVDGGLSMIEVGTDGSVHGVNSLGQIYRRDGITRDNRVGTSWTLIEKHIGRAKHVSFDLNLLWVVTTEDKIFRCSA
ncbi:uncharacterized protein LOC128338019 [Hemicordylus capensis]|uniref:uncharacterized protein LOC128338019 n=1 Tax=Hemicordylus capensis TaxID=884348 RepID=UPI0023044134|nr:uncharacterized protein LOC128338019 [Hemicordylus capensis]